MFIKEFTKKQQEAFLNLAYTMIYADNQLAEEEEKIFQSYKHEVDFDLSSAHKVDFSEELSIFVDCNESVRKKVFLELYAIALIDDVYAKEEEELVKIMQRRLNISDDTMKNIEEALKRFIDSHNKLNKVVNS